MHRGRKQAFAGSGVKSAPAVSALLPRWGQKLSGVRGGHVCGSRAAGSLVLSSHSLQRSSASVLHLRRARVGPAGNWLDRGPGDGDVGGRRGLPGMSGWALRGKQPLPISCVRWEVVGGIPGRQQEAKACPQHTCPVLGLYRGGLSRAPSSAEPRRGHFCLAFCSVTHQHGRYPGVPCLGAPRDGSPAHMGSLYPLPSWLGDTIAMPAGFSPASAWSRLAQAGRLLSALGAGVGLAIIACTLMSVTSSPRDTRYLQQTCFWHLAANPGISGCGEGSRWSPARPGPPGQSAACGPGAVWAGRYPRDHQGSWVPSEATSKERLANPRGIPTRDLPRDVVPSRALGKAPVHSLSDDSREMRCSLLPTTALPSCRRSLFWESSNFHVWARSLQGGEGWGCSGAQAPGGAGRLCPEAASTEGHIAGPEGTSKPSWRGWEPKNCSQGGCSSASPSWATPRGDGPCCPRAACSAWLLLAPKTSVARSG